MHTDMTPEAAAILTVGVMLFQALYETQRGASRTTPEARQRLLEEMVEVYRTVRNLA
jgi:hypothetical protein